MVELVAESLLVNVYPIIAKVVQKFPADIDAATDVADKQIRKLPEFNDLVDSFVRQAIREMIHRCRHQENVKIKAESGEYGQPSKVIVGNSEAVNRIAASWYSYHIAGTVLGDLLGEQLPDVATRAAAQKESHAFEERLIRKLIPLVPAGKRVRAAVKEATIKSIVKAIGQPGDHDLEAEDVAAGLKHSNGKPRKREPVPV